MKITRTIRTAVRAILDDSNSYDAESMVITRDGVVTALRDADKTFAGNDATRYHIAHVNDMVQQDGTRQEGW